MTAQASFQSQVDVLTKGIADIAKHAESLTGKLASLRAECGALSDFISGVIHDKECMDYVQRELKRISSEKP